LTSQSRAEQASITEQPQSQNNTYKPKSVSNEQIEQQIVITECLCDNCTGLYIDTLTKSVKIVCLDQRHNTEVRCK
jgi:formylmethanofuran dehydrogenase subunit E